MHFIFIFGVKNRQKVVGGGEFFCPHCNTTRTYQHKESRPYISLYFIPLIPISGAQDVIECTFCRKSFAPDVVFSGEKPKGKPKVKNTPTVTELLNTTKDRLQEGEPADHLIRDLTAAGLDFDIAVNAVSPYLQPERAVCETCGLSYAPNIKTCAECGQPLTRKAS